MNNNFGISKLSTDDTSTIVIGKQYRNIEEDEIFNSEIIIFGIKHKIIEHITETLLDKNTFEKNIINSPINTEANNPIKIALDNNYPYVNKFGNRGAIPNCTLTSQPAKPYIEKIIIENGIRANK